jgi:hypothetical protein
MTVAAAGLGVALLAFGVMSLRFVTLEEAANERTLLLLTLTVIAALLAGAATAFVLRWLGRTWPGWLRAAFAAPLVGLLFSGTLAAGFAVHNRVIEGHIEEDAINHRSVRIFVWSHIGAVGLFTPTGWNYLYPWPLPVIALLGGALVAVSPEPRSRPHRRTEAA